jgi:ParB-like nuclease domain
MSSNKQATTKLTSMQQILIKDIEIGDHFRRDLGDVNDIATSIKNNGLIHPIAVTKNYYLIAGRRRIEAFKKLGLEQIPVTVIDIELKENGELNDNSIRNNFNAEEIIAVKKYLENREINLLSETQTKLNVNKLQSFNDHDYQNELAKRRKRIAKLIGTSDINLRKLESLYYAASNDPRLYRTLWDKVNLAKISISKAFNIYRRVSRREQLIKEGQQAPSLIPGNVQLIHGDFIDISKNIPDNSIDLIFTDPKYSEKSLFVYKNLP